jgi:hypothetical protein
MARNVYFTQGTKSEQYLIEDLIVESLKIYGQDVFYIPRVLVNKDIVFGEDVLSKFEAAYQIEMYFEDVDDFQGQGTFLQKFGIEVEKSATLVVARRTWEKEIGRHGVTRIASRPAEGDLIYFPLTKKLFEVRFVEHEDPFYQLGKLYVYKLRIETFQYASEKLDTGVAEIDAIEDNFSYDQSMLATESLIPDTLQSEDGSNQFTLETEKDPLTDGANNSAYETISTYNTETNVGLIDFSETNPFGEVKDA